MEREKERGGRSTRRRETAIERPPPWDRIRGGWTRVVYIRVCVYAYTGTNTRGMVGRKKRKKKNKTKKTREQKKGVARAGVEGKNGAGGGGAGLGYTVVGNATINITYRHGSL